LAALTGLLLAATLLSALTRLLLLPARPGLPCAALLSALVLLASALILVHDISFCCGGARIGHNAVSQQLSPRSANFADAGPTKRLPRAG
jgi:hypothetical protein